jgi:chemotaxis protein CheD
VLILHPGEYYATRTDLMISTVLGSCVGVALYDPQARVGGLNHFMLPGSVSTKKDMYSETGKYGVFAMELLVNEMVKMGANRPNLRGKIFGGGHVLRQEVDGSGKIPEANIRLAQGFLETEGIPVDSSDVGGNVGRKIFLFPQTFRVLLKRMSGTLMTNVEQEEKQYLERLREEKKQQGEVTLF